MEAYIWLALIIAGVIAETATAQLVSIWFVLGFLGGLIAYYLGAPVFAQIIIAVVVSILSLIFTKIFFKDILNTKTEATNSDRHIGEKAIITLDVGPFGKSGEAKIGGLIWLAVSADENSISEGTIVVVEKIEGNKLIVKNLEV
ncbi:MAG: NfeD family protein [Clostridia bacterium]